MQTKIEFLGWSAAVALSALLAACGGGSSGGGDTCPDNASSCKVCDADGTNCRILNKTGDVYKKCSANDLNCAAEGQLCNTSFNCPKGNICNLTREENYDSTKPDSTCVKVVCATNEDCNQAGATDKFCSLEKLCRVKGCQVNDDCVGGQLCSGGQCVSAPDPANVASCVIVTPGGAIRQGATVTLNAVARNQNGVVLPGIRFAWASSESGRVSVAGNVATGGAMGGAANITATVEGKTSVSCDRPATLTNYPTVAGGAVRVVLVNDLTGAPITGATVVAVIGGAQQTATTGADGTARFNGAAPESVTVTGANIEAVTVIQPGSTDIYIPVPTARDSSKAGGVRGVVDISKSRRAEVQLGIVGPAIPANFLDFDLASLIGDSLPTEIKAPELQVDTTADLPGNLVFGLGATRRFTVDTAGANQRCQGDMPTETQIGCFLARLPEGPGAVWSFAGQIGISKLTPLASRLSGAIGGGGGQDLPIGEILSAVLPLFRTLYHGINSGVVTSAFPKVAIAAGTDCSVPANAADDSKCRGDFSKYQKITLAADTALSINSAVTVPTLPRQSDGTFADGAVMLAVAVSPGRGLVPLGLSAALDETDATKTGDGVINGVEQPFGANSATLPNGQMALTMAPPHSGIEGARIALVTAALDPNSIGGSAGTQVSGLVKFVSKVSATESLGGAFLGFPTGTLDVASKKWTAAAQGGLTGATLVRYELQRNGRTWLVYAPGSLNAVDFPAIGTLQNEIFGAGMEAFIQAVRAPSGTTFAEVFTFGSGKSIDKAVEKELVDAFVIQECKTVATATCKIQ
jgi:hypothetical protein